MKVHATAARLKEDGTLELSVCLFDNPATLESFSSASFRLGKRIEADKVILELVLKPDPLANGLISAQEAKLFEICQEKELIETGRNMILQQFADLNARFQQLYQQYQRLFHYTQQSAWRRLRDKPENLPIPETFL